ncbi:hypothetical protein BDF20DRAFT_599572 [Mycotypha africana]|uniref:uncharacterized protein n=1 Tax=Mycotypha africana TaxID=64632 RepID=UPI0022FFC832|nr:uncharacterized protein BDF20DRAFT_599572 [Mycotypha africana]KAI8975322.1 hypothetical protein BDF20DRAFT_599572 [Mycotypha africana]
MSIPEKYKNYKLDKEVEGSKEFFQNNIPESWTFENYLDKTFDKLSKNNIKNIKYIYSCFHNDLQWLLKLNEVPDEVKNYIAATLKPQEHYTKKELKSFIQSKKGATVHKPLITKNYINTFNSGVSYIKLWLTNRLNIYMNFHNRAHKTIFLVTALAPKESMNKSQTIMIALVLTLR